MAVTDARQVVRQRAKAKTERERQQRPLFDPDTLHHDAIADKLAGLFDGPQYDNFTRCGHENLYRTCLECHRVETFPYRCSLKWCPRCAWWLQERRAAKLRAWAKVIQQPKHLVLTQTNFATLTPRRLEEHADALKAVRRLKCFKHVRGGAVSVEMTHEGRGWHLHSHWLLDARWIDMAEVSQRWGKLVGQAFAIVKIKDVRGEDYVREVCKYLAKGSDLAAWPPELLNEFVRAIKGRRFFNTFGSLFKMQSEIRAQLNRERNGGAECDCGSHAFTWEDERGAILNQLRRERRR